MATEPERKNSPNSSSSSSRLAWKNNTQRENKKGTASHWDSTGKWRTVKKLLQRKGKKSTKSKRQRDSSWGAAAAVAAFPETNDWVSSKKGQQERALNCRATFDGIYACAVPVSFVRTVPGTPWSVSQRSHTHVHTSIERERVFFLCPSSSPPKRSTQINSNQVLKCAGTEESQKA